MPYSKIADIQAKILSYPTPEDFHAAQNGVEPPVPFNLTSYVSAWKAYHDERFGEETPVTWT